MASTENMRAEVAQKQPRLHIGNGADLDFGINNIGHKQIAAHGRMNLPIWGGKYVDISVRDRDNTMMAKMLGTCRPRSALRN